MIQRRESGKNLRGGTTGKNLKRGPVGKLSGDTQKNGIQSTNRKPSKMPIDVLLFSQKWSTNGVFPKMMNWKTHQNRDNKFCIAHLHPATIPCAHPREFVILARPQNAMRSQAGLPPEHTGARQARQAPAALHALLAGDAVLVEPLRQPGPMVLDEVDVCERTGGLWARKILINPTPKFHFTPKSQSLRLQNLN